LVEKNNGGGSLVDDKSTTQVLLFSRMNSFYGALAIEMMAILLQVFDYQYNEFKNHWLSITFTYINRWQM
jgi:hypothetical protein